MANLQDTVAVAPTNVLVKPAEITRQVVLEREKEFRFEVDFNQKFIVKVQLYSPILFLL
jgi:hypothetical protein